MKKTVLIQKTDKRLDVAVLEDKYAVSAVSESADKSELCGNIYMGRICNTVKGMQAAFADIGLERTAFLSGADNLPGGRIENVKCGMELPLQIVKIPGGDKGALVSANIKLSGRLCVLLPQTDCTAVSKKIEDEQENERLRQICRESKPEGMGLIIRTNAEGCQKEDIEQDVSELCEQWKEMQKRASHFKAPFLLRADSLLYRTVRDTIDAQTDCVWINDEQTYAETVELLKGSAPHLADRLRLYTSDIPLFSVYGVNTQIEKALSRRVWLKSGGFLVFDTTEAMHVVDVNTGKFTGNKEDIEQTALQLNLEAAEEIARQIRLRDLGGMILIDFIDLKQTQHKEQLLEKMRSVFQCEGNRTTVVDITPLGLCEISRKKKSAGLKASFETEKMHE